METFLGLALLAVGFAGALTAFAGDTVDKNASGKTYISRITRVGWVSIILLTAAFGVGAAKELADRAADNAKQARAAEAEKRTAIAQQQLADANQRLRQVEVRLEKATGDLAVAQAKLDGVKPAIVKAVGTMTQDIPQVYDDGFLDLEGRQTVEPISLRSHRRLELYGGDDFEYHCYCTRALYEEPSSVSGLSLEVGRRRYLLDGRNGTWRIAGPAGVPMHASIVNSSRARCNLKWSVKSTVRVRSQRQLASALAQ